MRIRGVAAMLGAALALTPAACSGDDETTSATTTAPATTGPAPTGATDTLPPEDETGPIVEAAERTAAQGSARVATSILVSRSPRVEERFEGAGVFDFEEGRGRLAFRLLEGEAGPLGGRSTAVFADSSVFVQVPPGVLPGGSRWIRLELRDVAEATGIDFGPLVQGSQADPTHYLLWLASLAPGITAIGEEEIRGVPTTRYRAAVDLSRLAEEAPPGQEEQWSAYVEALRERIGLDFVPVEVWVDGDGLVRRIRHEHGFGAEGDSATVTTELYDFGVPVDVQAPPPGQVTAMSDLISR